MDTSALSALDARPRLRPGTGAFSLVEVTLAIGIIAFGFTTLLGLIPTGMNIFRQTMNASVGSQVVQRVLNEARQMDFDELCTDASGNPITVGASGLKSVRYFDEQGNEATTTASPVVYEVNTRVLSAAPITGGSSSSSSLANVTVQIVSNPGKRTVNTDPASNLWADNSFAIATYSGLVARSK